MAKKLGKKERAEKRAREAAALTASSSDAPANVEVDEPVAKKLKTEEVAEVGQPEVEVDVDVEAGEGEGEGDEKSGKRDKKAEKRAAQAAKASEKQEKKKEKRHAKEERKADRVAEEVAVVQAAEEKVKAEEREKCATTSKNKKAKKLAKTKATDTNQWEHGRRNAQKELQQLVLGMLKEGAGKEEIREAKLKFKRENDFKDWEARAKKWMSADEQRKETAKVKGAEHDLVIVPIRWRKDRAGKNDIDTACENIKARLMLKGVDAWLDGRREYTPGQKFAYWEHLGVMSRIEVGPDDLAGKQCTMCKAETAGVPPAKIKVPLDGPDVLKKLLEYGLGPFDITEDDEDYEHGMQLQVPLKQSNRTLTGDADDENFVLKQDQKDDLFQRKRKGGKGKGKGKGRGKGKGPNRFWN